MKKTISLLSTLLLSSALFWGVSSANANELVETEVVEFSGYWSYEVCADDRIDAVLGSARAERGCWEDHRLLRSV